MDDADFHWTNPANSPVLDCRLPIALAGRNGNPWYIAYLEGRVTVMRIVRDRAEAIAVACAMLDEGVEVTRVGPMLGTGQEIDPASLRELWWQRRRV
jgi:hypothetical protein